MRNAVFTITGLVIALIVVLAAVAPGKLEVEREVVINKPLSEVFAALKDVRGHRAWSPWARKDPNMKQEYSGKDGEVGFIAAWEGNKEVGRGEQEIKAITENKRIDFELRFKEPFENRSSAYFITDAIDADTTRVRWGMTGKSRFPMNIICMLMGMKEMLIRDFDQGLLSLKKTLEAS